MDQNETVWSPKFRGGNRYFLTTRLWGAANQPPYFHHGQFTTMRQAVLSHHGEALPTRLRFQALPESESDAIIEFLKTLRVLPPGTESLIVDEQFRPIRRDDALGKSPIVASGRMHYAVNLPGSHASTHRVRERVGVGVSRPRRPAGKILLDVNGGLAHPRPRNCPERDVIGFRPGDNGRGWGHNLQARASQPH